VTAQRKRLGGRSERVRSAAFAAALALYNPGEPIPSMRAIADRAGVQKTTLYRRWESVEALLHDALAQSPAAAIGVPDTGSLCGDLKELATAGHGFMSSVEGRSSLTLLLAATDTSKDAYWTRRYEDLRPIFTRAAARGEISASAHWEAYLDVIIGSTYSSHALKGRPIPLDALLVIVDLLCRPAER